jgi:hypothetical protein
MNTQDLKIGTWPSCIQKSDLHNIAKYNEDEHEVEFNESCFDMITNCCNFTLWKIRKYGDTYTARVY